MYIQITQLTKRANSHNNKKTGLCFSGDFFLRFPFYFYLALWLCGCVFVLCVVGVLNGHKSIHIVVCRQPSIKHCQQQFLLNFEKLTNVACTRFFLAFFCHLVIILLYYCHYCLIAFLLVFFIFFSDTGSYLSARAINCYFCSYALGIDAFYPKAVVASKRNTVTKK